MTAPTSQQCDVVVVGAGPAGSSAALALACRGWRVAMLEKAALPRYKTCGGGLLARANRLLPAGLAIPCESLFHAVTLSVAGTDLRFTATRREPLVRMVMRADFDAALVQAAQSAGVEVRTSCSVQSVSQTGNEVVVQTNDTSWHAQFLIAADGASSPVARLAGWPALPHLAPALECEIQVEAQVLQRFRDVARFDFDMPPHGYGWVFPKREHLSLGVLSMQRGNANLNTALDDYLRWLGLTGIQKQDRHGWVIPVAPRPGPLARGRILLAGDAAGLVDPVTAEGISHALLSGRLVAQAILQNSPPPACVAAAYQALLNDQILTELRAARRLASVLYHWPRCRNFVFRRAGGKLAEFMAGLVMGQRSYRAELQRPASFLKAFGWKKACHLA